MSAETLELKISKTVCDFVYTDKPTPEMVRAILCRLSGITVEQFMSKKRLRECVSPRQVSMWYFAKCRKKGLFLNSYASIGEFHNGKDHATVMYHEREVDKFIKTNDQIIKPLCVSLNNELRNLNKHFVI